MYVESVIQIIYDYKISTERIIQGEVSQTSVTVKRHNWILEVKQVSLVDSMAAIHGIISIQIFEHHIIILRL
jgi:hypothetical protein